jgi:nucleoside-diphosphate-sugar epimerase
MMRLTVYDVQKRVPNTDKAKELLGFEAKIGLSESVTEVIDYMRNK